MARKLVSIRKVKELKPIKDADFIELAIVDGWQCVVKKGEFKVNDLGFYFEVDSFLPLEPEFNFLKKSCLKKMNDIEGLRLKTIRLKGKLSQGLLLPYKTVERFIIENPFKVEIPKFELGNDFTKVLGVTKYEAPIPACLSGSAIGSFPSFLKKTDQERIQNLYDEYTKEFSDDNDYIISQLEKEKGYENKIKELKENRTVNEIKNLEFENTIKLDGSSMTCYIVDPHKFSTRNIEKILGNEPESTFYFGVCSRNLELRETKENTLWKVANRDIKEKLIQFFNKTKRNIAIQGELMGEGIQGNREKLKGHHFFCYEIWDIDKQRYLTRKERNEILNFLNIKSVPFLENIKIFQKFKTIEELLDYAEGKSINNDIREGIVLKSLTLVNGQTISFKIISNKFLLKGGD